MQEKGRCLPNLAETIDRARPMAVLAVGETATRAITGIAGLWSNIQWLREHGQDPRKAEMLCPPEIKKVWPHETLLIPMPHTSPLAWNRNAPDGHKWSEIGREQVRLMAEMVTHG